VQNKSESTARVAMFSSVTAGVGAVVYPDSDMLRIFTSDGANDIVVERSSAIDEAAPWSIGQVEEVSARLRERRDAGRHPGRARRESREPRRARLVTRRPPAPPRSTSDL
jgi:hypothetical protein